jgi:hypothetical protein
VGDILLDVEDVWVREGNFFPVGVPEEMASAPRLSAKTCNGGVAGEKSLAEKRISPLRSSR